MPDLNKIASRIRLNVLELSNAAKSAHVGSCLSCVDALVALYFGSMNISPDTAAHPERDRLIFSKGHCAAALFCALAARGFFPQERLFEIFNKNGGVQEHPNYNELPGVEATAGSLGHGLPVGLGLAVAARIAGMPYKVYVIVGDGECNEGSIWEAAMLAGAQKTSNLHVLVDYNKWQATGRSGEIMALEPMADKWRACGWDVAEIDGHDISAIMAALEKRKNAGNPLAVVAHTIKGKGVSFMENDNNWHYRIPTVEEIALARKELA